MTVQELINKLQKVENKELEVIIKGTDPTDFTYYNEIVDMEEEEIYNEDFEYDEDGENDDDEFTTKFVIDAGMF